MMVAPSDFAALKSAAIPRGDALCRRLGSRLEPAWGFVLYGVLFFLFAPAIVVLGFGTKLVRAAPPGWASLVLGCACLMTVSRVSSKAGPTTVLTALLGTTAAAGR